MVALEITETRPGIELAGLLCAYADAVRDAGGAEKWMRSRRSYRTQDAAKTVYQMYCGDAQKAASKLAGWYGLHGDPLSSATWANERHYWAAMGRFRQPGESGVAQEMVGM